MRYIRSSPKTLPIFYLFMSEPVSAQFKSHPGSQGPDPLRALGISHLFLVTALAAFPQGVRQYHNFLCVSHPENFRNHGLSLMF